MTIEPAPPRPVRLVVRDEDVTQSRLTVFLRLLLALPHLVWLALWAVPATLASWAMWVITLIAGRPPASLHRFVGSYVRYAAHVFAYLFIAGRRFPGFLGRPGYEIDIEIEPPERQPRLTVLVRMFLALPVTLLALGIGAGVFLIPYVFIPVAYPLPSGFPLYAGVLGWFAALALGRMPRGLRDLSVYGINYAAQVAGYALLLTDRFPDSRPALVEPPLSLPEHPVTLRYFSDLRRSRLTVFFRLLLALPHLIWISLWGIAATFAWIAAWIAALVLGRVPVPLHRFLAAYVRYEAHLLAFLTLVGGPFPGFVGAPGSYPIDIEIAPARPQPRLLTLFRVVLVLPAAIIVRAVVYALLLASVLAWFSCLVRGRMPRGLCELGAALIRYVSQTNAYVLLLTSRYPYASPALAAAAPAEIAPALAEPEPEAG